MRELDVLDQPPGAGAAESRLRVPRLLAWAGIVAVFFGATAPQLARLEFSGAMENLNLATALELRRDHAMTFAARGPDGRPGWLLPTLEGRPRVRKSPLAAWVTALAIRPETVARMSDPSEAVRRQAAADFAFQARWPALLAACLMLVAAFELGRVVADPPTGLLAAAAAGTSLLFLRNARAATTDVYLGLFVAAANVLLAHALLRGRRWGGMLGAGLMAGLACMAKNPGAALVETAAPALAFVAWRRCAQGRGTRVNWRPWVLPVLAGLAVMLLVGCTWWAWALSAVPGAGGELADELERGGSPVLYFALLPYLLPWTVMFVGGAVAARRGMLLPLCLAVLPLLLLSFWPARKERFMYPMLAPAAVLVAHQVMLLVRRPAWSGLDKAAVAQHWALLVVIGVGAPAAAATLLGTRWAQTFDGTPWLSRPWGAGLTVALGLTIAGAMLVRKHWPAALAGATVVVMLAVQAALVPGYARTESGASPMRPLAEQIWRAHPDAEMYNAHPRGKRASVDLSIYLNRVTRWVSSDELAAMAPGPRAKVVVMLQEAGQPEPAPPAGWERVGKVARDRDHWWAYALPPADAHP